MTGKDYQIKSILSNEDIQHGVLALNEVGNPPYQRGKGFK
jgi:hypothetical protein